MKNRIPTQYVDTPNGKAIRYAVYNELGDFLRFEYLILADEPTENGTPLSMENLLSNITAAAYNFPVSDGEPTPNKAFAKLIEHWWRRKKVQDIVISTSTIKALLSRSFYTTSDSTIHYSSSINSIKRDNANQYSLINTKTVTGNYTNYSDFDIIKGKYFVEWGETHEIYKADDNASIYKETTISDISGKTLYQVYTYAHKINPADQVNKNAWEYLSSIDVNAYPKNTVVDGYEYEYLGNLLGNISSASKISAGSYVGTGTYGENNPNKLTFSFIPKVLIILGSFYSEPLSQVTMLPLYGKFDFVRSSTYSSSLTYQYSGQIAIDGTTVSWYSDSVGTQLNNAQIVYYYVAIG